MNLSSQAGTTHRDGVRNSVLLLAVITVVAFFATDLARAQGFSFGGRGGAGPSGGGPGGLEISVGTGKDGSTELVLPGGQRIDTKKLREGYDSEKGWKSDQKEKEIAKVEETPEVRDSEEVFSARKFLIQADMGIDPKLQAEVTANPKETLKKYLKQSDELKKAGKIDQQRETAVTVGHIYYLQGLMAQARSNYSLALDLYREANDLAGEARMLNSLGAATASSGNYREAMKYYDDATVKFKAADDAEGLGRALNNLAMLAKMQGLYAKAVNRMEEALKTGAKADEARVLRLENLGKINAGCGQYKQAVEFLNEALDIARKNGDEQRAAQILASLGETYKAWGNNEMALDYFQQALALQKKTGERSFRLNNLIGYVYMDMGEIGKAEPFIKEGKFDSGLGRLCLMKSDYKGAKQAYEKLRKSAQVVGRPRDVFTACTGLGRAHEGLKNLKEAEKNYKEAMNTVEDIRASLLLSERRDFMSVPINGFLPSEPAKGLIRILLKQNKPNDSILPGEVTRARDFADRIAQRAEITDLNVPKEISNQEQELSDKLASLIKARSVIPGSQDQARYDQLTKDIRKAEVDLKSFYQKLDKDHPAYAAVRNPKPVALQSSAIKPNEHVLVLDVLGDGVGVKLIKGKKIVASHYEPWDMKELRRDVQQFRAPLEQVKLNEFNAQLGKTLYDRLLAKAISKVPDGTPITVIADGILAVLPFGALVTGGEAKWEKGPYGPYPEGLTYLGDSHPVSYYQSITALTLTRALGGKSRGDRVLVVADPVFRMTDERAQQAREVKVASENKEYYPRLMAAIEDAGEGSFHFNRLPGTAALADGLRKLCGDKSDLLTGLNATKPAFLQDMAPKLDSYRWMIFATHGVFSTNIPGLNEPFLAMTMVPPGTDGFLNMSDVMALKLNADVVALTACQSGLGKELSGEGVMSMGRAFQYAGAASVLMTLWSVAEESSVLLAENFFRHLESGKTKRESLSLAKTEVREAGFRHPFFWAAFELVGESE